MHNVYSNIQLQYLKFILTKLLQHFSVICLGKTEDNWQVNDMDT